ncbi:MAG TPA: hypothetical protein DIS62_01860 [Candidatus Kerfeldbacteria bacterium]|nr:hypothetical protein [Candidatus Kerfeldbacteria bacterium]
MQSATFAYSPYGAFELKSSYQRLMAYATLFAALIATAPVIGFNLYQSLKAAEEIVPPTIIVIDGTVNIPPPPSITRTTPHPRVNIPDLALPAIGIPTPVPDAEVTEEVRFATREELADLTTPVGEDNLFAGADSIVINAGQEEYFPGANEFVSAEEQPVRIECTAQPVYPEMARLTRVNGSVWVKALVDKYGKVRDVVIAKPSGSSVGFEEAAIAAAKTCIYNPAIQNGNSVAIWVTYEVKFSLGR